MGYLKAERMKCKRTMINRLLWIAPLMTAFLALFMGGFYGYQYMTFYWWYTFLLPGIIAILCAISKQREERAGKYYSVLSLPIDLAKFEWAKAIILIEKLMIAALIFGLLVSGSNLIAPTLAVYSTVSCVFGSVGIIVASIWQIPICLYLSRRVGLFLPVVTNVILSILSPIMLGNTQLWWLWPYCWAPKLAEGALGIQINGTFAAVAANWSSVFITMLLSLLLFGILTWFDAKSFGRKEGR